MARQLRIEYPGALYHITSRGDGQENIYLSNMDMEMFLAIFATTCERYHWYCYAYCLMHNHYHLLIETPLGNLSKGMQHLNGIYTQQFNKKHQRVGHVFQGRYKGILVDKEHYLLELSRYIVLNPLRAKIVEHVSDWKWSSYSFMLNTLKSPPWLKVDALLDLFSNDKEKCQNAYIQFVQQGRKTTIWKNLKNQIYLGTEEFVNKTINYVNQEKLLEIPKIQYMPPETTVLSLDTYKQKYTSRDEAIYQAYISGHYTMKKIGDFFGLHYSRISKIFHQYQKTNL